MVNLLRHLNNKILINDLIVKKMKYEVNMLFFDQPSKEKAKLLASKINNQIDTALVGLNEEDKESVRKNIIRHSFLVVQNPASDHVNYGHVFTTLTNFDDYPSDTKKRLSRWLDLNTALAYDDNMLSQYITLYKIKTDTPDQKVAAIEYQPKEKPTQKKKYRLTARILWVPVTIIIISLFSFILKNEADKLKARMEVPPLYESSLNPEVLSFIDSYYEEVTGTVNSPYAYSALDFNSIYHYLKMKNSKLIGANYLSIINSLSASYDVNPLLLIAIIGQEQNFVPSDHEYSDIIINNPYNIFGSWVNYNTDFEDATTICLNTIETALNTLPEDEDLITWLNETYAEDKNWSIGVKTIFTKLQSLN